MGLRDWAEREDSAHHPDPLSQHQEQPGSAQHTLHPPKPETQNPTYGFPRLEIVASMRSDAPFKASPTLRLKRNLIDRGVKIGRDEEIRRERAKCVQDRLAEVNSQTNPSTYSLH